MGEFTGKRVTVAGLGHFGGNIAAARWFVEQGARVLVTDVAPAEKLADSLRQLQGLAIEYRLGAQTAEDFSGADLVVASPAIPPEHPLLAAARAAGVSVTTEICLFVQRCRARVAGVTGTKGKSTTATLLHRMLGANGRAFLGGNIGKSLLGELDQIGPGDLVVLELSSYMLHYLRQMAWSPDLALVTMISADHLQWHGSLQQYVRAKQALLEFQRPGDWAVLNEQCPTSRELATICRGTIVYFGLAGRRPLALKIPGKHNQLNAQAAFAAAGALGVSWDAAQAAVADFTGLPHRLQLVREAGGLRYYNDSIATIPEAAVAALDSFAPRKVIQIVGGYEHGLSTTAMCAALVERAKAVLCIGATGPALAETMAQGSPQAGAPVYRCGDLATAVSLARRIGTDGDVVLLSTGFKSYDQFANFEERGQAFERLVNQERGLTGSP